MKFGFWNLEFYPKFLIMRYIAIRLLSMCARAVLRKYQPKIVAITGTVGKSSAKEAAFAVLKNFLVTRESRGNYNTEIGVPLTIIDLPAPGKSFFKWLAVGFKTLGLLFKINHAYPDVLVLEMGADKPGDIDALTNIAIPQIAVVTAITPAHLLKYGSLEALQKEKARIWYRLGSTGVAVGNIDDPRVSEELQKVKIKKITYGFSPEAEIRSGDMTIFQGPGEYIEERIRGVAFKLYSDGSALPVHLSGVFGRTHVSAATTGAAIGLAMGLNYHEIVEGLHEYRPLPGRMRLIPGIKHTLLLDDSYNSSPAACRSALEELKSIPVAEANKRYAILGDMLELGAESARYHLEIGRAAAQLGIDVVIGVGELGGEIVRAAKVAGMEEGKIFHFARADEAGRFAQDLIKYGDVILIKGSRAMRMERITKELMAEPLRAEDLLVQ